MFMHSPGSGSEVFFKRRFHVGLFFFSTVELWMVKLILFIKQERLKATSKFGPDSARAWFPAGSCSAAQKPNRNTQHHSRPKTQH